MNKFTDQDGCEIAASVEHDGDYPTIQVHVTTPWDTYARVDLTFEQAQRFAAELLATIQEMRP